jgi:methyl-accepting chemotaxis protein
MLKVIANIPIFRRLFYAFLLAAVIPGLVITLLGIAFINTQDAHSQALQTSLQEQKATGTAGSYLQDLKWQPGLSYADWSHMNASSLAATAPQIADNVHHLEQQFESAATSYRRDYQLNTARSMESVRSLLLRNDPATPLPNQQEALLDQVLMKQWPAYKTTQEQMLNDLKNGTRPTPASYNQLRQRYTDLKASWDQISTIADTISMQIAQSGPSQNNPILMVTIVAFLGTIMVVTIIGYIVNLTITRPLRQLATLTRRIAKGETNARAVINSQDEISMVATSMNNMLDNIVRLIQETQSQRDWLQSQVEKLVSEVSGVGEGDLRVQAEVTADALGVLADSFNYMVEELGSLVVRVKTVANEVEQFTTTVLDRMTHLVDTGDMQIEQIEEAVVNVDRMTALSRQVADRAQGLYEVARIARHDAQLGRESVQQAVEGMARINDNVQATAGKVQTLGERSRAINDIVEVISSIAHQTNRLALDAAIQAAMAGENGKGFGAVAADIRRLAERAKDQVSMIGRIVRSVSEDIGAVAMSMQDTERETRNGSKLTQDAGVALESIFAAVEHQAHEIESINHMAMQQLQSSSSVVRIMHSVSEATQQGGMSTRQTSENMQRLSRLVEQLRASVEAFKLREDRAYFVPTTSGKLSLDDGMDNPLTVSGVFRTVSATARTVKAPVDTEPSANTLLPPQSEDPFAFYPRTPHQSQPDLAWEWVDSAPYSDEVSDEVSNSNGSGKG